MRTSGRNRITARLLQAPQFILIDNVRSRLADVPDAEFSERYESIVLAMKKS